mmetsp:Transcript_6981/g.19766  ORF Transcript_6981/g.19766 Transcript_6981/m.19766 type:complete len:327 (+) Transcript_6981:235-1215(+)
MLELRRGHGGRPGVPQDSRLLHELRHELLHHVFLVVVPSRHPDAVRPPRQGRPEPELREHARLGDPAQRGLHLVRGELRRRSLGRGPLALHRHGGDGVRRDLHGGTCTQARCSPAVLLRQPGHALESLRHRLALGVALRDGPVAGRRRRRLRHHLPSELAALEDGCVVARPPRAEILHGAPLDVVLGAGVGRLVDVEHLDDDLDVLRLRLGLRAGHRLSASGAEGPGSRRPAGADEPDGARALGVRIRRVRGPRAVQGLHRRRRLVVLLPDLRIVRALLRRALHVLHRVQPDGVPEHLDSDLRQQGHGCRQAGQGGRGHGEEPEGD